MARPYRPPSSIQHVYIADGFADDCDELIHRCSRVDILSYQTFCIYYKEMNFASLYQGRTSNAEIAELSEEVLQIAKYYMVLDTSNFEESVAGLFLVYALLNLQPYPNFASLRLVPDDIPAIERIQQVARRSRRLDVLYVLGSVLTRGPVQYHAAARARGMEGPLRKYLEGFCNIDITGVRPKGVYFRQNEELDIFRDMTGIFKRYSHAKGQIPGLQKRVLSYSNDNLAVELGGSLKRLINGIVEEEGGSSMQHHNAVQEIKKRAMKNAVSTVRHLDSAEQRSPEKKIQQQQKVARRASVPRPNQRLIKLSPKPKKKPKTPAKKKHKRKNSWSSSSSEDSLDNDEKDEEDWCIATHGSLGEISKSDEQEIYVEIDALPSFITTESDGKLVEIEIIDEMKKDTRKDKAKVDDEGFKDTAKVDEKSIKDQAKVDEKSNKDETKVDEKNISDNETEDTTEDSPKEKKKGRPKKVEKSDDEIFKKPLRVSHRLKTVQKRDMKKSTLKSKFKKMGMLPVANFDEQKEG